jgi:hypothetical protein
MMLVSTFFETKLAVGRFGWILGYGRVLPTVSAISTNRCLWARAHTSNSYGYDDKQIDVQEPVSISFLADAHSTGELTGNPPN